MYMQYNYMWYINSPLVYLSAHKPFENKTGSFFSYGFQLHM